METRLIVLGTGNAMVTRCWNTCFGLRTESGCFLVDAGGGNGIFTQIDKAGIDYEDIPAMFVTHTHTDHILGAVWMVRKMASLLLGGKRSGQFRIYGHAEALHALTTICNLTLPPDHLRFWGEGIAPRVVEDGETAEIAGLAVTFFDIGSTKARQFGFRAVLPDRQTLVCLGDEPYRDTVRSYVKGCDWLLAEAFCLDADKAIFKPYEKHHSTALDAGRLAETLGVKNLVLYHTEDATLATRKARYTAEAGTVYSGNVFVPDDLEVIAL